MPVRKTIGFLALVVLQCGLRAAIPSSELYPFPGYDLDLVRAKTAAESSGDSAEIVEAWKLYGELQGAWAPQAKPVNPETTAHLDRLKKKLEGLPVPFWFSEQLAHPGSGQISLADKIGDETFRKQKASPEYQNLKALALVYLSEHELDRTGAAQKAGEYLSALAITHPWDWQVHGLYGRFLIDAQQNAPAWDEARLSLFLNPDPSVENLKSFAFVGSIAAHDKWIEIEVAIREASKDDSAAERAILESEPMFTGGMKVNVVLPRKQ
jgi:hypothetical protein